MINLGHIVEFSFHALQVNIILDDVFLSGSLKHIVLKDAMHEILKHIIHSGLVF